MNRRVRQLGQLRALSAAAAPALVVPGSARSGLTDVWVMNIRCGGDEYQGSRPIANMFSTHCKYQGSRPIAKAVLLMQGFAGLDGSMGATLSLIVAT
jgi:hypothetical protein